MDLRSIAGFKKQAHGVFGGAVHGESKDVVELFPIEHDGCRIFDERILVDKAALMVRILKLRQCGGKVCIKLAQIAPA